MATGEDNPPTAPGAGAGRKPADVPPGNVTRFPGKALESAPAISEEENDYFPEIFEKSSAGGGGLEAAGSVAWARPDRASPCYSHLLITPGVDSVVAPKTFEVGKAELEYLIAANRYQPRGENDIIAFGIRGAKLREEEKAEDVERIALEDARPDHRNFRCVLGFYFRAKGLLAAYTASTVPWHEYMSDGKKNNLLPTGCYIYKKGDHVGPSTTVSPALRLSDAEGAHSGLATVLRTKKDLVFGLDDAWDLCNPSDNIHCAFSNASFSSLGCQTIKGSKSSGLWTDFQSTIEDFSDDARVDYVLVTGAEAAIAAALIKAGVPPTSPDALRRLGRLRVGSEGDEVKRLQEKLGVEPTGYFGAQTKKRLTEVQSENKIPADGIYSPTIDARLGWGVFTGIAPQPQPASPQPQPAAPNQPAAPAPVAATPAVPSVVALKPDAAPVAQPQALAQPQPVSSPAPVSRPDPVVVARPVAPPPSAPANPAPQPAPAVPPASSAAADGSKPAASQAPSDEPAKPATPAAPPPAQTKPAEPKPFDPVAGEPKLPEVKPAEPPKAPEPPKAAEPLKPVEPPKAPEPKPAPAQPAPSKPAPVAAPAKPAAPPAPPKAEPEPEEEAAVKLTVDSLKKFAPKARPDYLEILGKEGNEVLSKFEINDSPLRLCHFMAQVGHECGGFTITTESLKYSAERMVEIFGPGRHSARLGLAEARTLVGREEAFAERVYGLGNPSMARNLGNTEPGDGYRYRGRGFLQITGRAAYREMGKKIGIDLEANPDLAAQPLPALMTAAAFWASRDLNTYADEDDIVLITKRINGGRNGLDDRERRFDLAKKIWGEGLESVSSGKLESVGSAPRLELGSFGPHVARLKHLLRQNGYGPLAPNEDFDRATHIAVVRFKLDHSLPGDGIVDALTWERLEAMAAKSKRLGEPRGVHQENAEAGYEAGAALRKLGMIRFWGGMLLFIAAVMALIRLVNAAVPLNEGWHLRQFEFALIVLIAIAAFTMLAVSRSIRKAWMSAAFGRADYSPPVERSDVDLGIRPAVNVEPGK